ncbi:MAG TPA: hypothetical protein VLY85_01625 [Thermoplasmata archaeon]|nr:hypothetical protein [Thermoplasmata archaeon]
MPAPTCPNCGASDFVWAKRIRSGLVGIGGLSLRAGREAQLGTRICRECGHADLFLSDVRLLNSPHLWKPGEFVPIPEPAPARRPNPPSSRSGYEVRRYRPEPTSGSPAMYVPARRTDRASSRPPMYSGPPMGTRPSGNEVPPRSSSRYAPYPPEPPARPGSYPRPIPRARPVAPPEPDRELHPIPPERDPWPDSIPPAARWSDRDRGPSRRRPRRDEYDEDER